MDGFHAIARRYFLKLLGGAFVAAGARAASGCDAGDANEGATSESDATDAEYDYIVVGSGAGGGPLAANLARQGFDVLLLEAGEDRGALPSYQVPAFNAMASEDPSLRWDYFVRHYDDDAQQARDPKATAAGVYYPRGGTLGGCTAVNALITVYPHASDFQHIADLTDDASWSPQAMRPYYERMEQCEYLPAGAPGHGRKGWLRTNSGPNLPDRKIIAMLASAAQTVVSTGAARSNIVREVLGDIRKIVVAMSTDLNSPSPGRDQTEGLFAVPLASAAGARNGPREYILRVKTHYKLTVKTRALAAKVVFAAGADGGPPVAIGVDYLDGSAMDATTWKNTARYRADRDAPATQEAAPPAKPARLKSNPDGTRRGEVILACGVFNTPQLLKLSGVGPSEELTRLGIPVVVDLPGVGTNLQDRYEVSVVTEWSSSFDALNACTFGQGADFCYQVWQMGRVQGRPAGAYATGPVAAMITRSSPDEPDPDLVIFGYPADFRGYRLGYSKEVASDHRHFSWSVLKAHTKNAAGTVTLRSTDPRDTPEIRFRYFGEGGEKDLAAVIRGVRLAREIAKGAPALLAGGPDAAATFTEILPGAGATTDRELGQFVRDQAWGHHASCTCPIGPRDRGGVLDSRFRVHGTKGLRVVDASIFPKTPGFFLALPIYMASEKAFDVIVADAGQSPSLGPL